MADTRSNALWHLDSGENLARQDADIDIMLADLAVAEAFNAKQAAIFSSMLRTFDNLAHRLVSLESRIAHFELGVSPPKRLRNLSDVLILVADLSGVPVDEIRDRSPKSPAAIIARQCSVAFCVNTLQADIKDVAMAFGRASDTEIKSTLRHFALRRTSPDLLSLYTRILAGWQA